MISPAIQAICALLTESPIFFYGTADELNVFLQNNDTFPVALMYNIPQVPAEFTLSYSIQNKFSFQIKFLYQSTFDQNTSQNERFVESARVMANEFMVKLANYRVTPTAGRYFKVHQKDKGMITPVYNDFDTNLTGVKLSMTVMLMYTDNVSLT